MDLTDVYNNSNLTKRFQFETERHFNIRYASVIDYPFHMHDGIEIIYIMEGRINVTISYDSFVLEAGDFLIINPYDIHRFQSNDANLIAFIECDDTIYDTNDGVFIWQSLYYKMNTTASGQIKKKLIEVFAIDCKNENSPQQLVKNHIDDLLILIKHNFSMELFNLIKEKKNEFANNELSIEMLNKITMFLYKNYTEAISLDYIAKEISVSKFYISHMIKNALGSSFQETLGLIRLDRSLLYLLGTNMPIGEIPYVVHFSSYQYYNKLFKKIFNTTPKQYRKANLQITFPKGVINETNIDKAAVLRKILPLNEERLITIILKDDNYNISINGKTFDYFNAKDIRITNEDTIIAIYRKENNDDVARR